MLDIDVLLSTASGETGLTDFGDPAFREPLTRLVTAMNTEAGLSQQGEMLVTNNLVQSLKVRLEIEDYLKSHPQLLERPIEKPMFVFGLPRTGTTLAINLLHEDPERRCFLRWEAFAPVPPPKPDELYQGPRYDKSQAQTEMGLKRAPHIAAIHYEEAGSPTECQFSMAPTFLAQIYDSNYHIPSYHEWFLHQADYLPAFQFHKRFLQLLQAEAGGRWTLKNPWHPLFLNELMQVYPDAQLVMTHRDPVAVLGSACSLLGAVRPMFSSEVDRHAIGKMLIETFDQMIERVVAYKKRHGADSIYDLQYAELMQDPIGTMKKLYDHFGEPLSDAAAAAMTAYLDNNPKGKHGKHEYSLEEYGLTASQVRNHYREYCEMFSIPCKD